MSKVIKGSSQSENKDVSSVLERASASGRMDEIQNKWDNNYMNPDNGFGGNNDPQNKLQFNPRGSDSRAFFEASYQYDWLGRKIVNAVPEDALREWIDLKSESTDFIKKMNDALDKFKVRKKIRDCAINGRLYGGSLIVIGADDGQEDITQPLKEDRIKSINYITVLDRHQVEIKTFFNNPLKDNFGEPEIYRLQPSTSHGGQGAESISTEDFEIHSSRVVRIDGNFLPDNLKTRQNGWGDSVLLSVQRQLMNHGTSIQSVSVLLQDFITKVLKVENLAELLRNDNAAMLEQRIKFAIKNQSTLGVTLIGENESMEKIQHPVTGLKDIIDILIQVVSAASDIPRARLFGQQLGTLAGADETTKAYFDLIKGYQVDKLNDPINRILFLFSKDKSIFSKEEDYQWKFNPLRQLSDEEQAKRNKDQAQADALYIDRGVLDADEVAKNRFSADGYSLETVVDFEKREEFNDLDNKLNEFTEEEPKQDAFSMKLTTEHEEINIEVSEIPLPEAEVEEELERDTHVHEIHKGFMSAPKFLENGMHYHIVYRDARLPVRTSEEMEFPGIEGHTHAMPDDTKVGEAVDGEAKFFMTEDRADQKEGSTTQSIVISKEVAGTLAQAKAKAKSFGKIIKIEETSTSYRFRQIDPNRFKEGAFLNGKAKFVSFKPKGTNGVTLILGKLK